MAKPWGRYEIGFLGGTKFRALNANAICLWWEIKSYCDEHLNDGRFPATTIKTFRFYSAKALEQLTRSAGLKPNGQPFAPLLERQDIGGVAYFVMHDYLDHNDCRDKVMARKKKADEEREKRAIAQQAYRDRKKADQAARDDNATHNAGGNGFHNERPM